jgi:hypothetical protein
LICLATQLDQANSEDEPGWTFGEDDAGSDFIDARDEWFTMLGAD